MFQLYDPNQYKFANRIYYKIDDVMIAYKNLLSSNGERHNYKNIIINGGSKYLSFIYNVWKNNHDLRCPICGCKANHFRLMKFTQDEEIYTYHLFGLYKVRKTNDCTYVFFNRDHIMPKSLGGENTQNNLRLICQRCNQTRSSDLNFTLDKNAYNYKLQDFKTILYKVMNVGIDHYFNKNNKYEQYRDYCLLFRDIFKNDNVLDESLIDVLKKMK